MNSNAISLRRKILLPKEVTVELPISKSECNRVLIIKALSHQTIETKEVSNANDSQVLFSALQSQSSEIDCEDAGTAMRFLTAFYAIQPYKSVRLSGTERMHQRPIKPLVDALRQLGADVDYLEEEGYPPLAIHGKSITKNQISIDASLSSQFVSALMLIGPMLPHGLSIAFDGFPTSFPYIELTAGIMREFGAEVTITPQSVTIAATRYTESNYTSEADWSAASYWYELATFFPATRFLLKGIHLNSKQGDVQLPSIYSSLGIVSEQTEAGIWIQCVKKDQLAIPTQIDCTSCPDLAQTLACTYAGLNHPIKINGLKTLVVKETNRLEAIAQELQKVGCEITVDEYSWKIDATQFSVEDVIFSTYNDHRMAMSLAPLASKIDSVTIENPAVVNKSYPMFWEQLSQLFDIQIAINC